jgi:hypothetical protein
VNEEFCEGPWRGLATEGYGWWIEHGVELLAAALSVTGCRAEPDRVEGSQEKCGPGARIGLEAAEDSCNC